MSKELEPTRTDHSQEGASLQNAILPRKFSSASTPNSKNQSEASDDEVSVLLHQLARQTSTDESVTCESIVEAALTWTHTLLGDAQLVQRQEKYFTEFGKVFFDDAFYDARTSYFFDLLLFDKTEASFFERFVTDLERFDLPEAEVFKNACATLLGTVHSLFKIKRISKKELYLVDQLSGERFKIKANPEQSFRALFRGQWIQGHIYPAGEDWLLSNGLLFHPERSIRVLKKLVKIQKKTANGNPRLLFSQLALTHLRHLRHRHVDARVIYLTLLSSKS